MDSGCAPGKMVVKLVGLSPAETWADAWNRLDLLIIALSYISMALEEAFSTMQGTGVGSLRALRLLRQVRQLGAPRPTFSRGLAVVDG